MKKESVTTDDIRHFTETDTVGEVFMQGINNVLEDVSIIKTMTTGEKQTIQDIIYTLKTTLVDSKKLKLHVKGVSKPKMADMYEQHLIPEETFSTLYHHYKRGGLKQRNPRLKKAPHTIQVVGSYMLKTGIRQQANIDVTIDIPENYIQDEDISEYQYHIKRAAYMAAIKNHLETNGTLMANMEDEDDETMTVESIDLVPFRGDFLKPIVELKMNSVSPIRKIRIMPTLPEGVFATIHDIRMNGKLGIEPTTMERDNDKVEDPAYRKMMMPTPFYNHSVAEDRDMINHVAWIHDTLQHNVNSVKTLTILKLWLRQRDLHANPMGVNGFLMTMIVIYLLKENKLSSQLTVYQQLRLIFEFIGELKPYQQVLYIQTHRTKYAKQKQFFEACMQTTFPLNIIADHFNIAWRVTPCALAELQYEAAHSLKALTMGLHDIERAFALLFFTKGHVEEYQKYDASLKLTLPAHGDQMDTLKMMRIYDVACYNTLLFKRVNVISIRPTEVATIWMISIQIHENYDYFHEPTLYGPVQYAMNPTMKKQVLIDNFKKAWGARATTMQERQTLYHIVEFGDKVQVHHPLLFIEYIMQQLIQVSYISIELRMASITLLGKNMIMETFQVPSLVQSYSYSLDEAFQTLDVLLREVNLAMKIKSLERLTAPTRSMRYVLPLNDKKQYDMLYVHPVMLTFTNEHKWPDIPKTIAQLKQLIFLRLASQLKQHVVQYTPNWLDLMINGHLFRLAIFNQVEYNIYTSTGHIMDKKVQQLERTFLITPKHLAYMHGLTTQYPILVALIRTFKGWIQKAIMLNDQFETYHIELFAAYIFTTSMQEGHFQDTPRTLLAGLARLWKVLGHFDFAKKIFYVAFPDDDKVAQKVEDLENRRAQLATPHIMIGATYAESNELSKFQRPSMAAVAKLQAACQQAYTRLMDQLDNQLFTDQEDSIMSILTEPQLQSFDIVYRIQNVFHSNTDDQLTIEDIDMMSDDHFDYNKVERIIVEHPMNELVHLIRQRYGDFVKVSTNGSTLLGFTIATQLKDTPDQSWPIGISFAFATDGLELAPTLDYRMDKSNGNAMYTINLYNIMKGIDALVTKFFPHVDKEYRTIEPKFVPHTRQRSRKDDANKRPKKKKKTH